MTSPTSDPRTGKGARAEIITGGTGRRGQRTAPGRHDDRYQILPPLAAEEYAALRDDIAENGVRVPVVVDQHGHLLDGHHRVAIAEEIGIEVPTTTTEVADEAEARDTAFALNLARRHLSRWQKHELIVAEIEARPDDADRAIARRFGCSPTTVGSVRRQVSKLDTPAPPEPKRRRRPLPEAFDDGSWKLVKATEQLVRLAEDDRWKANSTTVAQRHLGKLDRAIAELNQLRDAMVGAEVAR